ncbi:DUF3795 domain-containing protein [Anaeroselena agilis]|uniref:DUF3795 domain-containing protein n=1 Tax=Anaeroselena agilis TaxID=3063788 RepID=A0ABU3P1N6_9FIRM|nr:DUF3795 domain-containing protein [Selenomonadales bacterium 4137-cl]
MDRKLVCPCGLTCCDCLFYKPEIYEAAFNLRELIKKHGLDTFLSICSNKNVWKVMGAHLDVDESQVGDEIGRHFDAFEQMPAFMSVLDGIIKLQCKSTCQEAGGCSFGGNKHECGALKCIRAKGYDGCWQCSESEQCEKLTFLKSSYGFVIEENLTTIRERGAAAVEPRGNQYYGWQRRSK